MDRPRAKWKVETWFWKEGYGIKNIVVKFCFLNVGAPGEIRTHTLRFLKPLTLPLAYRSMWCGWVDSNHQVTGGLSAPHLPFCYIRAMKIG